MAKTNKQKCLEMWQWLAENPGEDKTDYFVFLRNDNRSHEFSTCWACVEATDRMLRISNEYLKGAYGCGYCPVKWGGNGCHAPATSYSAWSCATTKPEYKQAAEAMVKLIEETWEE